MQKVTLQQSSGLIGSLLGKGTAINNDKLMWRFHGAEEELDGEHEFVQTDVADRIENRAEMRLEVWCKDKNENSFVGLTRPMLWQDLLKDQEPQSHELKIYNKDQQTEKLGTLSFETRFTEGLPPVVAIVKKKLKPKFYNQQMMMRGISPFLLKNRDGLTDGTKAMVHLKQESHQRTQLKSRIANLQRQTELANKKLRDQQKQAEFVQAMASVREERLVTIQEFRKKADLETQMKHHFFRNQRIQAKTSIEGSAAESLGTKRHQSQDVRNLSQHLREQIQAQREKSIKRNREAKLKILADRKKAQEKQQAEESRYNALRKQRAAERTIEIDRIRNENQLLASLEAQYVDNLQSTQNKLATETQAMTMLQSSIYDRMTNGGDTSRTGRLKMEMLRTDYAQTPERGRRIKFYAPTDKLGTDGASLEAKSSMGKSINPKDRLRLKTPAVAMRFRNTFEARTQQSTDRQHHTNNLMMNMI